MFCQFHVAFSLNVTQNLSNFFYRPPPPFYMSCSSVPALSLFGPFSTQPALTTSATSLHNISAPLLLSLIYVLVTVQIYLSRSAKRTATGGSLAASTVTARSATSPQLTAESSKASTARRVGTASKVPPARKTPSLNIQLRKTGSLSSYSPLDTPSYRSPIKSPSQYFQICY